MDPSRYQLYAFEFYVAHLRTSLDLINLRVEMKLFNAPYAVIKPKMDVSQSMWVMKSHVFPDGKKEEVKEEKEPFLLDLRSVSSVGDGEEVEGEDEIPEDKIMNDATKMAAFDPCAKDGPKKNQESKEEDASNTPIPEELNDSVVLVEQRSQLRVFPEDPTGMPYFKVKKGELVSRKATAGNTEILQTPEVVESQPVEGENYTSEEKKTKYEESDKKSEPGELQPKAKSKARGKKIRMETNAIPSDIFESGVTILLPMEPLAMLYNLQRVPIHVRVCNEDNRFWAEAYLDLWPLFECVLRAERGPPTPVTSSCEIALQVRGNFEAVLYSMVRLFAFGNYAARPIKSKEENPNDEMSYSRPQERTKFEDYGKDIQTGPPIVSSPDQTPRVPPKQYTQEEEEILKAKQQDGDDFFARNIAYCPIHRIVTPMPKDNYETIRWKIDKMLGLTEVRIEECEAPDEGSPPKNRERESEEISDPLTIWHKEKKKELRMKSKKISQTRAKTRTILQKILAGMENPEPIKSKPDVIDDKGVGQEEVEDEEKSQMPENKPDSELTEEQLRAKKAKFLFDEIRRQQQEERMIKHYKRIFRMMLKVLESERGVDAQEQRRRQRQRKRMQDLLMELETYGAEDVELAFIKVMKEKTRSVKKMQWDLDYWPSIVEEPEGEIEEIEEEVEEEETQTKTQEDQTAGNASSQLSNKENTDINSQAEDEQNYES